MAQHLGGSRSNSGSKWLGLDCGNGFHLLAGFAFRSVNVSSGLRVGKEGNFKVQKLAVVLGHSWV